MHYLLSRAILQVGSMLIGQTGYVRIVVKGSLADEMRADPLLKSLRHGMLLYLHLRQTL